MRDILQIQEDMDVCLEQRDEELQQLRSQSQVDGAQLAALSVQMQELISSVESRAEVVGRDLEEVNGRFNRHRGEINHLKIQEKDAKEETEMLKGFIVGAGHEAQVFKNHLDRMEEMGQVGRGKGYKGAPAHASPFSYKITSRAGYYTFTKCQQGWFLRWHTLDVRSRGDGYNIASGAG